MIQKGYIEVNIYRHRIKVVVSANFVNSLGMPDWILHYYFLEYHNRLWRWLLEDGAMDSIKQMSEQLGLPIQHIYNFKVLYGDKPEDSRSIKSQVVFDINKIKRNN